MAKTLFFLPSLLCQFASINGEQKAQALEPRSLNCRNFFLFLIHFLLLSYKATCAVTDVGISDEYNSDFILKTVFLHQLLTPLKIKIRVE